MPNYKHFIEMTDDTGMLQFSRLSKPDPASAYTIDDNVRALLLALFMGKKGYPYALHFSNYMLKAQKNDGKWYNFLLDGQYSDRLDSEDSNGRAILACSIASHSEWETIKGNCSFMLKKALPNVLSFTSPRAIAYVLVGLCKGKIYFYSDRELHELVNKLSDYLISLYNAKHSKNWMWFEDYLTYCNGIIPHALFCVYAFNNDNKVLKVAHESLSFLNEQVFNKGYLSIVGNYGWYQRDSKKAVFDQQPVDAASIAFACYEAYQSIGRSNYLHLSQLSLDWYHGKNIHGISLYDKNSGGCYDALTVEGVNLNQGAEAILSLLMTELLIKGSISENARDLISS